MTFKLTILAFFLTLYGCQRKDLCTMDLLLSMEVRGYKTGYAQGETKARIETIYLCHDWIPLKGYKAWRQCNTSEILYKQERIK